MQSVSRLALALAFPDSTFQKRFTFQKNKRQFVVPLERQDYLLIGFEPREFGHYDVVVSHRTGTVTSKRTPTEVGLSDAQVELVEFFASVQAHLHREIGARAALRTVKQIKEWIDTRKRDTPEEFEDACKRAGVTPLQLGCTEMQLDIPKHNGQRQSFFARFVNECLKNVHMDLFGKLWEPALMDRGMAFCWKAITRADLDQVVSTGMTRNPTTEEYIRYKLRQWRQLNETVEDWCGQQDWGGTTLADKFTRALRETSRVPLCQFREDQYFFFDQLVDLDHESLHRREILETVFPYWYSLDCRPDPKLIGSSAIIKFLRAQRWDDHTIWALFVFWGLALMQNPEAFFNFQMSPYFLGQASTGKSTIARCIKKCFWPEHVGYISKSDVTGFRSSQWSKARLIHWGETSQGAIDGTTLKEISSGEASVSQTKYQNSQIFEFRGFLLLDGNSPFFEIPKRTLAEGGPNPQFEGQLAVLRSYARRFVVFPFMKPPGELMDLDKELEAEHPLHVSAALFCAHQALKEGSIPVIKERHLTSYAIDTYREAVFNPLVSEGDDGSRRLSSREIIRRLPDYSSEHHRFDIFSDAMVEDD